MKILQKARKIFRLVATTAICLSCFSAIAADTIESEIILGGLSSAGKTRIAWLKGPNGQEKWCREGETFSGHKVKYIDITRDRVTVVTSSGTERELNLKSTPIAHVDNKFSRELVSAEKLNWSWIKSEANPMRRAAEVLPDWALKNWDSLSEDIKLDFRNRYRIHGWDFTVTVVTPDRIRVSNTRIVDPNAPTLTDD